MLLVIKSVLHVAVLELALDLQLLMIKYTASRGIDFIVLTSSKEHDFSWPYGRHQKLIHRLQTLNVMDLPHSAFVCITVVQVSLRLQHFKCFNWYIMQSIPIRLPPKHKSFGGSGAA